MPVIPRGDTPPTSLGTTEFRCSVRADLRNRGPARGAIAARRLPGDHSSQLWAFAPPCRNGTAPRRSESSSGSWGLPEVLAAAERLWSNGHAPNEIRIRTLYVRNPKIPDVDLWVPFPIPAQLRFGPEVGERKRPASHILPPVARLIVSQGVALQFHLTALFAAHCQSRPGQAWDNQIPLSRRTPDSANWLDLVAVSAKSSGSSAQASTYMRNKLRQFRSALGLLARNHVVDLGKPGSVNRYEGFRLLSEDASSSSAGAVEYRVPCGDEDTLKIPFQFFTRGVGARADEE